MKNPKESNINVHPGKILRAEIIRPTGLTIGRAADFLGVSRLTLSNILNERSSITPNMALRIAFVFGGDPDCWLELQRRYDLNKAEKDFEKDIPELTKFRL